MKTETFHIRSMIAMLRNSQAFAERRISRKEIAFGIAEDARAAADHYNKRALGEIGAQKAATRVITSDSEEAHGRDLEPGDEVRRASYYVLSPEEGDQLISLLMFIHDHIGVEFRKPVTEPVSKDTPHEN